MPHYKSIAEFESLKDATPAETALIAACKAGEPCIISEARPEVEPIGNTIRADLLRLLIIGGSKDCGLQDSGVWLEGGWITGKLNLNFATARGMTRLDTCTFTDAPVMGQAHLRLLSLKGSHLPGLRAESMVVDGSVIFRGLIATRPVNVIGARIEGQLTFKGAKLDGQTGPAAWEMALNAQSVTVGSGLLITEITAMGMIDVNGARITGQFECGGTINGQTGPNAWGKALYAQGIDVQGNLLLRNLTAIGKVDLNGAQVSGQLSCSATTFDGKGDRAFSAQRMEVKQGFVWRNIVQTLGEVYLAGGNVGDLVDDLESWPPNLYLDGFTYDRIGGAATDARVRLGWLAKGAFHKGTFYPQPYTQLAKVLFAMGHDREARKILMASHKDAAAHDRSLWRAQRRLARSLRRVSRKQVQSRIAEVKTQLTALPASLTPNLSPAMDRYILFHSPFPSAPSAPTPPPPDMMELARQDFRNEMWALAASCRLRIGWNWTKDIFLRGLIGYGHAPERSLVAMVILIAITGFFAASTWSEGSFAPNSAVILTSPEWVEVAARDCKGVPPPKLPAGAPTCDRNPAETWSNDPDRGMDWTSFSPEAYAADLVIPVLDLGQTSAWAPSKDRGSWGWFFWWASWWLEGLGWVITALAAAAITGLIQRDRE